jgi:hypothetical protein
MKFFSFFAGLSLLLHTAGTAQMRLFENLNIPKGYINYRPVANDDYFNGAKQGFDDTIRANVYGGSLITTWESNDLYQLHSLPNEPAVQNGADYVLNDHSLSEMVFEIVGGQIVYTAGVCDTLDLTGNIVWNKNGTFEYVRRSKCISRIRFQYKIIDRSGIESDTANVTIDFLPADLLTVLLTSFTAEAASKRVQLHWDVERRNGTTGFYVQKNTGERWENRAFIPAGMKTSGRAGEYTYSEILEGNEICQYRLMIVNAGGFVQFSQVRSVQRSKDLDVLIHPNPSTNGMTTIEVAGNFGYTIEIYRASGERYEKHHSTTGKAYTVSGLKPGIYMVLIRKDGMELPQAYQKLIVL